MLQFLNRKFLHHIETKKLLIQINRAQSDRAAVATEKSPKVVQPLMKSTLPVDDSFVGMTGGEIFHEMMLRHEVKHVFGYPGGAILPVFDAIYESEYFDFILPRHEQGAGHMAEGYAKAT